MPDWQSLTSITVVITMFNVVPALNALVQYVAYGVSSVTLSSVSLVVCYVYTNTRCRADDGVYITCCWHGHSRRRIWFLSFLSCTMILIYNNNKLTAYSHRE